MGGMSQTITPSFEEIQAQLKRILASKGFANSDQRKDLLRYLVSQTLKGQILTEKDVCADVFPSYAIPPESRIVSVVATEIRKRLRDYYEAHPDDLVIIAVPSVERRTAYQARFSYTKDPPAVESYNLGHLYLEEGSLKSCEQACSFFEKATILDPAFVLAFAAQAEAEFRCALLHALESQKLPRILMHNETGKPISDGSTRRRMKGAQASAKAALKMDQKCSLARIILGATHACHLEWSKAEVEFEIAKSISPDEAANHPLYAAYLLAIGDVRGAFEIIERRIRISPTDPFNFSVARLFRYVAAIPSKSDNPGPSEGRSGIADDPNLHWLSRVVLNLKLLKQDADGIYVRNDFFKDKLKFFPFGFVQCGLASLRNPERFLEEAVEGMEIENDLDLYLHDVIEWDFDAPLNLQRALAFMALAVIRRHRGIPTHWCTASRRRANSGLSRQPPNGSYHRLQELAVNCIQDACRERDPLMVWLHLWPIFDTLRERPDFRTLIRRMNLPTTMAGVPAPPMG